MSWTKVIKKRRKKRAHNLSLDIQCDYNDCTMIMFILDVAVSIAWIERTSKCQPNKQAKPIQPDKMNRDKDWGTAHKVMWLFLIPQRHTHKCMFNKTKINCPMSAIVHSAIASNIRSSDSVYIIFFSSIIIIYSFSLLLPSLSHLRRFSEALFHSLAWFHALWSHNTDEQKNLSASANC